MLDLWQVVAAAVPEIPTRTTAKSCEIMPAMLLLPLYGLLKNDHFCENICNKEGKGVTFNFKKTKSVPGLGPAPRPGGLARYLFCLNEAWRFGGGGGSRGGVDPRAGARLPRTQGFFGTAGDAAGASTAHTKAQSRYNGGLRLRRPRRHRLRP